MAESPPLIPESSRGPLTGVLGVEFGAFRILSLYNIITPQAECDFKLCQGFCGILTPRRGEKESSSHSYSRKGVGVWRRGGREPSSTFHWLILIERSQSKAPTQTFLPGLKCTGFLLSWTRYLLGKPQCEKSPWGTRGSRRSPWIPACTLRTTVHFQPSIWLGCRAGKQGSS